MKSESHLRIDKDGGIVKNRKIERFYSKKSNDLSAINLGYYLVTPLLVGVFLGSVIGARFQAKEKGALIGIILGLVSTIYNLIKILKSNARD